MKLTDSHCHLQDVRFGESREDVIFRAQAAGVSRLVINGTSVKDWGLVAALASEYPGRVIPCFGMHPWFLTGRPGHWSELLRVRLLEYPAGIGETGLDLLKEVEPVAVQEEVLRTELEIACELSRPITIHCLRAWGQLLELLKSVPLPQAGTVIHGFGSSRQVCEDLLDLGCYISLAGSALESKRVSLHDAVKVIPRERILIESDAPDMAPPAEYRAEENEFDSEPANLPLQLAGLARLRGEDQAELAAAVEANSDRIWGPL